VCVCVCVCVCVWLATQEYFGSESGGCVDDGGVGDDGGGDDMLQAER